MQEGGEKKSDDGEIFESSLIETAEEILLSTQSQFGSNGLENKQLSVDPSQVVLNVEDAKKSFADLLNDVKQESGQSTGAINGIKDSLMVLLAGVNNQVIKRVSGAVQYLGFNPETVMRVISKRLEGKAEEEKTEMMTGLVVLMIYYIHNGPTVTNKKLNRIEHKSLVSKALIQWKILYTKKPGASLAGVSASTLTIPRIVATFGTFIGQLRRTLAVGASGGVYFVFNNPDDGKKYAVRDPWLCSPEGALLMRNPDEFGVWLEWAKMHHAIINRGLPAPRRPPFKPELNRLRFHNNKMPLNTKTTELSKVGITGAFSDAYTVKSDQQ